MKNFQAVQRTQTLHLYKEHNYSEEQSELLLKKQLSKERSVVELTLKGQQKLVSTNYYKDYSGHLKIYNYQREHLYVVVIEIQVLGSQLLLIM